DGELLEWVARDVLPRLREGEPARLIVAEVLSRAKVAGAAEAIANVYRETKDSSVRLRLLLALGQAGGETARKTLVEACQDRSELVRAAALRGLGRAADRDEEDLIVRVLGHDPSALVRAAAAAALGKFNDSRALEILVEAREKDRSRRVQ